VRACVRVCVCLYTGAGGATIFSLAARIDRHSGRYISFIEKLDCRMLKADLVSDSDGEPDE
jgi:hypothetical protein